VIKFGLTSSTVEEAPGHLERLNKAFGHSLQEHESFIFDGRMLCYRNDDLDKKVADGEVTEARAKHLAAIYAVFIMSNRLLYGGADIDATPPLI